MTQPHESDEDSGPPSGPLRYLIRCRRSRFEQRGKSNVQLVEKLATSQHLDRTKFVHLGTLKDPRRVHIIADYGNPGHQRCEVPGFKGDSLKDIRIPAGAADYLHRYVETWKRIIACSNGRFPIQEGDHVEKPPGWKRRVLGGDDGHNKPDDHERAADSGGMENSGSDVDADDHTSKTTNGDQLELGKADYKIVNMPNSPTYVKQKRWATDAHILFSSVWVACGIDASIAIL